MASRQPHRQGRISRFRATAPSTLLIGLMVALCTVSIAGAQTMVLRDIEKQLLAERLEEFEAAHQAETEAATRLSTVTRQLRRAMADLDVSVESLRDLESQVSLARAEANTRAAEATRLRLDIYDRMERLSALEERLESTGSTSWGTWTIDFGGESGTVILTSESGRIEGTYTLTGGRRGTLRGTLQGDRLQLERFDASNGRDRTLEALLSPDRRTLQGTWVATELGSGQRTSGVWVARRVDG